MHILYFHQHFSTPKGATGTRSYELAKHLVELGHEVTMVCGSMKSGITGIEKEFTNGKRQGVVKGINIIEFDLSYSNADGFLSRTWSFLKFAFSGVGIVMSYKYDLIFSTTTPLTAGIPGIFAKWLRRKPFVFEVRDLWPELPKAMGVIKNPLVLFAMSALEWASYKSADRCVALSPGIKEGIKKRGIKTEKIATIPNGCDLDIFANSTEKPWRPAGVGKNDLMAVFAGTHGQANGLESVLDAAVELKSRNQTSIKFVLIGDGKLKPELMARAEKEKLDNVIFHNPVPKHKLAGLLKSADIGMQCLANVPAFYYGTSPNKFFDYLSAGIPVLNNYPGWLADLIDEYKCGIVIEPDNPVSFADGLESANREKTALTKMGKNARLLGEREFDRAKLASKWTLWVTKGRV